MIASAHFSVSSLGGSRSLAEYLAEVPQLWKQLREVSTSEG